MDLLSEQEISYTSCVFSHNPNGKRYITNYPIFFNISHSFDFVICCIDYHPIGIDIEKNRPFLLASLPLIANKKEQDYIQNDSVRYFAIYTQKEACIKMMGENLGYITKVQLETMNVQSFLDIENYVFSICKDK